MKILIGKNIFLSFLIYLCFTPSHKLICWMCSARVQKKILTQAWWATHHRKLKISLMLAFDLLQSSNKKFKNQITKIGTENCFDFIFIFSTGKKSMLYLYYTLFVQKKMKFLSCTFTSNHFSLASGFLLMCSPQPQCVRVCLCICVYVCEFFLVRTKIC